jgi:hypothetical protein
MKHPNGYIVPAIVERGNAKHRTPNIEHRTESTARGRAVSN